MSTSLTTSASSMAAAARAQEIISRNLANVSTTGYRKGIAVFNEFSNALATASGNIAPTVVTSSEELVDFSEGSHTYTSGPLHLALQGDGFFVLQDPENPDRPLYTRKGQFELNSNSQIVTSAGFPLMSAGGGAITIPPGNGAIEISAEGFVLYKDPSSGAVSNVGQVMVADFPKPYTLERASFTAFREIEGNQNAIPAENTRIKQGYLEEANVDILSELVTMIAVMRGFQADQNVITATDETLEELIDSV